MLTEMMDRLADARDKEERERILRALERLGMDRASALIIEKERKKGKGRQS